MIVAQEKRKTNISEYLIYMWQIEDIIRALNFDLDKIDSTLVANYKTTDDMKADIKAWYKNLVLMMQKEQKQASGHLQFLANIADDLNHFHLALIEQNIDQEYTSLYEGIKDDIELVRSKSGRNHHDIEVALNTLYLIMMLKMKKQEVSEATQQVVWKFGNFMGHLSKLFKAYEAGDLEMSY